jgi:hypothetical protein
MRVPLRLAAIVCAMLLSIAGPASPESAILPDFVPGQLLDHFGYTMSAQEAMERVTFHPFVPTTSYLAVALLPAFHGDDKDHPENRGIGYEYAIGSIDYVLREWPRAGGTLDTQYGQRTYKGPKHCPSGYFTAGMPDAPLAVAWQTNALVFSLQPDIPLGAKPDVKALRTEWERLAQRGVCR